MQPPAQSSTAAPTQVDSGSAQEEGKFLNYVGHEIPWYVRVLWLLFWVLSAAYVLQWLLPALQVELLSPP